MACVSVRRNRYVLDYRDKWGRRRWLSYPLTDAGRGAAEAERARLERGSSEIEPGITLGAYITEQWLHVIRKRLDVLTYKAYEINARCHISNDLKRRRLSEVTRPMLKRHLSTIGQEHCLAEGSVAKVANVLWSIFECATDDELIPNNPALRLRKSLGIVEHKAENVRAMSAAQLDLFMATVRLHAPQHLLEFAVLAYGGLRVGEMRGLQLDDLQMDAKVMLVERQVYDDGRVGPVKGRRGKKRARVVDMADALHDLLVPALAARRACDMRTGARGPWLLYPEWGEKPGSVSTVVHRLRRAMLSALRRARIAEGFTPHSLRHTYARVMLEGGEDLLYVSRQLGHAGIGITADRYGHWARVRPRAGGANLLTVSRG